MAEFNKTESKENCCSRRPVIGFLQFTVLTKMLTTFWIIQSNLTYFIKNYGNQKRRL